MSLLVVRGVHLYILSNKITSIVEDEVASYEIIKTLIEMTSNLTLITV